MPAPMDSIRVTVAGADPAGSSERTVTRGRRPGSCSRTTDQDRSSPRGSTASCATSRTCSPTAAWSSRSRIDSADGRDILRHSTAHVMAQAVQELFPDAKLGIGPPITDGFYYDFDVEEPFTAGGPREDREADAQDHQGGPAVHAAGRSATTRREPSSPTSRTSSS